MKSTAIAINQINYPFRIGLISDTHIGKGEFLNPRIGQVFREAKVDLIVHLGDITSRHVIDELEEISRTLYVRGNRDLTTRPGIPAAILLDIDCLKIGLTHGHGTTIQYIWDKMHYAFVGFRFERYRRLLDSVFPDAQIKCFGHTHVAFSKNINGTLYLNPGAACNVSNHDPHPSVGIIHLEGRGKFFSEIIVL